MPGVLALPPGVSRSVAIDDLPLIAEATDAKEWVGRVMYLPLS
jgi:hypothetical protein